MKILSTFIPYLKTFLECTYQSMCYNNVIDVSTLHVCVVINACLLFCQRQGLEVGTLQCSK